MEKRVCKTCHVEKDISEFYFLNKERKYRLWECRLCKDARTKRLYKTSEKERQRRRESVKAWNRANPEKVKAFSRKTRLKNQYGLTLEQYDAMVLAQDGRCGICRTDKPGGRWPEWHVDHCHNTNRVRGLLCAECNRHLGIMEKLLKDRPIEWLLDYIKDHTPNVEALET